VKSTREFACGAPSIAAARRFVRDILGDHPLTDIEAVELMVSELATNSVKHARTGFEISITSREREIRVDVLDTGTGQPVLRTPADTEPSGRGLRIVKALSSDWGAVDLPGGNAVWFTLPSKRRKPAGASRLARSEPSRPGTTDRNRCRSDRRTPGGDAGPPGRLAGRCRGDTSERSRPACSGRPATFGARALG
jgi:anti-sigma regulatory factor (Ser/Thr protein kinase)